MVKYLIVECHELNDQYECDAERTPICLVDDYKKWMEDTDCSFLFEVYKCEDGKNCELIKRYDDAIESGMALYYWTEKEYNTFNDLPQPHVMKKWPSTTRSSTIPKEVKKWMDKRLVDLGEEPIDKDDFMRSIKCCGVVSWTDNKKNWWHYGEYRDNIFDADY